MKRWISLSLLVFAMVGAVESQAQCSICTKTAQQLGEKPAKALNTGIVYLAAAPLAIFTFIGIRWYKANKDSL
ncbi:hypothetical protein KJS94_12150 [Flavihumibacter rivuli]|uniref:hypothetical protein n=1 Tax=Flavihumibacter rivuli TaxID=2838156 RepID=UPI001BDE49BE|nr:hypothetical protein [Flavihumibacter rivuli]ULQ55394.1 hypothetical protein KJS94_12150 [Flavihumibacter rivuli]